MKELLLTFILLNSNMIIQISCEEGSECVANVKDLEEAVSAASVGDTVVICDGDYTDWDVTLAGPGLTLR